MIRNDGAVDHIKLIKAVDQRLDEAAIAALGKWKFHPALKGGVPVDVEVVVRIPFRLRPLDDQCGFLVLARVFALKIPAPFPVRQCLGRDRARQAGFGTGE